MFSLLGGDRSLVNQTTFLGGGAYRLEIISAPLERVPSTSALFTPINLSFVPLSKPSFEPLNTNQLSTKSVDQHNKCDC